MSVLVQMMRLQPRGLQHRLQEAGSSPGGGSVLVLPVLRDYMLEERMLLVAPQALIQALGLRTSEVLEMML
jgi:hypothetical protein